jgi:hypothetical protein
VVNNQIEYNRAKTELTILETDVVNNQIEYNRAKKLLSPLRASVKLLSPLMSGSKVNYSPFFNYSPMYQLKSRTTVILLSLFNIM